VGSVSPGGEIAKGGPNPFTRVIPGNLPAALIGDRLNCDFVRRPGIVDELHEPETHRLEGAPFILPLTSIDTDAAIP